MSNSAYRSPILLWHKRDLRVQDHPALAWAAQHGPVLPVYVVEPDYWALPDTSARQWAFTRECVEDLAEAYSQIGMGLSVKLGDVCEVFEALRQRFGITRMVSHEETGNLWTYQRDQRVAAWAKAAGMRWDELPQSGVVRRLRGRDGWAGIRNRFMARRQESIPQGVSGFDIPGELPDFSLAADPCAQRQIGGRSHALSLLGGFLQERGQTYRKAMSSPLQGEWACSRLSPYLALGVLSVREAVHAGKARAAEVKGTRTGWNGAMKSFQARLAWRDHFMQKLEDEPRIETHCLHRSYEEMRPKDPDQTRLRAWQVGETGVPFVDACMRFTRATGWLNFRMRAMVTSFASYHLWLDWRAHGPILARLFTDYEPGIHWSQVQMQSGTTGINTIRMYNPVKQGLDQDPTGAFTRQWCPELAEVPDAFLQEPWRWDGARKIVGNTYPAPVIDLKQAAKFARDQVWSARKGRAFRQEANKIIEKHASRKDLQGHFVNDRAPRRRKTPRQDGDQMSFDL